MRGWLVAVVSVLACSPVDHDVREALSALGVESVGEVYVVSLAGWGGDESSVPDTVHIEPGAVIVFQVADYRVHTVTFLLDSLPPQQARFMDRASQGQSPPLIERGSRYIVPFADAPAGTYPFEVRGFGRTAAGAIVVGAEPD